MVLRMEQGPVLQQQLPLHATDYSGLPIVADSHPHSTNTYNQHPTVGLIRRDNNNNNSLNHHYPFATPQSTSRFVSDRSVGESQSYQTTSNFTDSSSGSISTSPSSAASSLAYTSYPGTHYTSIQHFPGAVQLPQSFVPSTFSAGGRSSSLLDASTSSMLPPPNRSSISNGSTDHRDALHGTSTPYLARSQLPSVGFASYSTYPDTPRSILQQTGALTISPCASPYSTTHMAGPSQQNYGTTAAECASFPWSDLEAVVDMNCDGQLLVPKIHAKVEKGFFQVQNPEKRWTCYRRNYFSVTGSFELRPNVAQGRIVLLHNNMPEQVQAMGMRLSAAVDGADGKNIELVQHTPKRDAGPKTKIDVCRVAPTLHLSRAEQSLGYYSHNSDHISGPYLPLQHTPDDTQAGASQLAEYAYSSQNAAAILPGQGTSHTFERVQFKQATANNGKRRATQQFFHLIIELYADVRKDGSDIPVWVKVAQRVSEKIVVRGRSPSHYQNEKSDGLSSIARSSTSSIAGYTAAGATYGSMNTGGFRGLTNAYGNSMTSGNVYRKCDMQFSDHSSQSDGSGSSLEEGGAMDTSYHGDSVMPDADRLALHEHEGYQYFPSTMYENVHQPGSLLPPLPKLEPGSRYSNDPKQYAVKAEYGDAIAGAQYQTSNLGRFQGVDTSRGYFPDLQPRF